MKVLPFTIPKPENMAVMYQLDEGLLYNRLHQHEEVQISWIERGGGTLFAGDTIHQYQAGDLIVLGGEQPHVFRSSDVSAVMHSVFFSLGAFGRLFLDLEEGKGIRDFYALAKAGFKTTISPQIETLFTIIAQRQGIAKLAVFLNLITALSRLTAEPLSTFIYERTISESDGKRMNAIYDYTLETFTTSISLDGVARVASMTPNAFCKYFKLRTNKTYFEFVNELRINKACSLLHTHPDLPINVIADQCGFQNLSHFNRKFKHFKNTVPSVYRKRKSAI